MAELFIALVHHPVLNRNGRIVTSAVTSLDVHDMARSARTYGVSIAYVVHPIPEQREFAAGIIDHWRFEFGRTFDSRRLEALETIRVVSELDDAIADAAATTGVAPQLVYTSARAEGGTSFDELRRRIAAPDGPPTMILFGTGFGLAPPVRERSDIVLSAIRGPGDYNHLSVRAATSIVLDRLRGR